MEDYYDWGAWRKDVTAKTAAHKYEWQVFHFHRQRQTAAQDSVTVARPPVPVDIRACFFEKRPAAYAL
ncbi:MAG: hypothetical protein OXC14_05745 [Rhodospirillaceae bacterium]|nr:hypothetical protein [Rhodospirillaceae bacterium]